MGIGKALLRVCVFASITASALAANTVDGDADAAEVRNRYHIERWYEYPLSQQPRVIITEAASNTDDAYNLSSSTQRLHELVMSAKPYSRAYERTYERALNKFESNILDIGRHVARVESYDSGKFRFKESHVSDSFRVTLIEPPEHLIAADQIDNEFFSLRMTRWWNADDHTLHVDYYLLVRDVEVLPDDEHRFHDAVAQAQNLLKFTVVGRNQVVVAEDEL